MLKPECDILKGLCSEKIGEYKPCGSCYIGKPAVQTLASDAMSKARRINRVVSHSYTNVAEAGEVLDAGTYIWTVKIESGAIKYNPYVSFNPNYPADLCE